MTPSLLMLCALSSSAATPTPTPTPKPASTSTSTSAPVATPGSPCASSSPAFAPGEELTYDVTILGAEAGHFQINLGAAAIVDGTSAWPIVIQARSAGAFETLFPVRDRFISWWDPTTGQSVATHLTGTENGKRHTLAIHFARGVDGGACATARVQLSDTKGTEDTTEDVDPGAVDLAAAVFWLRTQPLKPGDTSQIPVFTGRKQWTLISHAVALEKVTTAGGDFDCVHVRLETSFTGKLASQGAADGWFSNDARHLPVRLDASLMLGHMRADLVKVAK